MLLKKFKLLKAFILSELAPESERKILGAGQKRTGSATLAPQPHIPRKNGSKRKINLKLREQNCHLEKVGL